MFSLLFIRPVLNYSPRQLVGKLFEALGFGFSVQGIHSNDTWKPCKVFVIFTSHCPLEWRGGGENCTSFFRLPDFVPLCLQTPPLIILLQVHCIIQVKKRIRNMGFWQAMLKHIIIDHSLFVILIAALVWLD